MGLSSTCPSCDMTYNTYENLLIEVKRLRNQLALTQDLLAKSQEVERFYMEDRKILQRQLIEKMTLLGEIN